jgi:glycosyltransferase involved in cell wall biosynthesis
VKIAILSSASAGGAGIAAFRIYQSFCDTTDHEVDFFDINAFGESVEQSISPQISATNSKVTNTHFTVDYASDVRQWVIDLLSEYDVLNVQWASYLISLAEINELAKLGKKIIFTLHDFNYITGGCHYPAGCLGYLKNCVGCPQVNENLCSQQTVIATNKIKREIFSYKNVYLTAPSAFIVENAIRAGIVPRERAHVLRNAYAPICEFEFKIVTKSKSILLIADSFDEQRKGLVLAVDSLKIAAKTFKETNTTVTLHLVGGLDSEVIKRLDGSGIKIVTHGHIKEHKKLVDIFKKCDFMLTCSYEDNWPNILVESGSYGCIPIVGKWHGCEEFIQKFELGFIADNYLPEAFARSINTAVFSELTSETITEYVNDVRRVHKPYKVIAAYIDVIEGNRKVNVGHVKPLVGEAIFSVNYLKSATLNFNQQNTMFTIQETPFGSMAIRAKVNGVKIESAFALFSVINDHNLSCLYAYGLKNINVNFVSEK